MHSIPSALNTRTPTHCESDAVDSVGMRTYVRPRISRSRIAKTQSLSIPFRPPPFFGSPRLINLSQSVAANAAFVPTTLN